MTNDSNNNSKASNGVKTDEALIEAYYAGKPAALEVLVRRYKTIILGYLFNHSFFNKDESYLDDVRQEILVTVFKEISKRKFRSQGEGSFKRWVYTIAHHECLNQDKKQRRAFKPVSQIYPEDPTGFPDDLVPHIKPSVIDRETAARRLPEAFNRLTPIEQKLMQLISQGKSYKEIILEPEFSKYSLDYLMRKVYIIRNKLRR